MGPALVELASGVDALYLSGQATPAPGVFERLDRLREEASEAGAAVPAALGDVEFLVAGHGFGKYRYLLRHAYGQVGITRSNALPTVRIQPRTEFLHGAGPLGVVAWFEGALWPIVGPMRVSVSRLDLHADWQGWEISGDDRVRFLCRAERRDLHEAGDRLMGFEFGRRKSGTLCGRIYDKTLEQQEKGADFWLDVWGDRYDPTRPVLRVEFEYGREGLRQFDIDTPHDVMARMGGLWAYAAGDWLSYRCPTADSTRARWPLAPEWRDVQRASLRGGAEGVERMYEGRRAGRLRTLLPILNGCVVAFANLIGRETIDEACDALPAYLRDYEVVSHQAFSERVRAKSLGQHGGD